MDTDLHVVQVKSQADAFKNDGSHFENVDHTNCFETVDSHTETEIDYTEKHFVNGYTNLQNMDNLNNMETGLGNTDRLVKVKEEKLENNDSCVENMDYKLTHCFETKDSNFPDIDNLHNNLEPGLRNIKQLEVKTERFFDDNIYIFENKDSEFPKKDKDCMLVEIINVKEEIKDCHDQRSEFEDKTYDEYNSRLDDTEKSDFAIENDTQELYVAIENGSIDVVDVGELDGLESENGPTGFEKSHLRHENSGASNEILVDNSGTLDKQVIGGVAVAQKDGMTNTVSIAQAPPSTVQSSHVSSSPSTNYPLSLASPTLHRQQAQVVHVSDTNVHVHVDTAPHNPSHPNYSTISHPVTMMMTPEGSLALVATTLLPRKSIQATVMTVCNSTESITADGIDLDEIKEFAKQFKIRRLSLGLTQAQAGLALNQTAISRFENLDITPRYAQKIIPVLEQWMTEAEESYKKGVQNFAEFINTSKKKPSKKRKLRTSFSAETLKYLNRHFLERTTHPSGAEMTKLAELLNYDREVIRVWFCNKRQILRNANNFS